MTKKQRREWHEAIVRRQEELKKPQIAGWKVVLQFLGLVIVGLTVVVLVAWKLPGLFGYFLVYGIIVLIDHNA